MPKRVGFLYDIMEDRDFIRRCIKKGARGKKKRKDVQKVLSDIEGYTDKMLLIVQERRFRPSKPKEKMRYDPSSEKWRKTEVVPFFPDGIMHQMEVAAMEKVLMRGMHPWSCASIPGRGGAKALRRAKRIIQKDPKGSKYGGELDIKGFYPSIPLERLLDELERKIKDELFLLLIMVTVTCYEFGLDGALEQGLTARDLARGRVGLQIGFYINQWLANYFLERADRMLCRHEGVKYEIRYMDNFSIFGPNKKKLHQARRELARFLEEELGVRMKRNWQIFPIKKRLFSIVGYRVGRKCVLLRKRNFLRLTKQCRRAKKRMAAGKEARFSMAAGLLSRIGQLKHCNSRKIRQKYTDKLKIRHLKEVVRIESQRRQRSYGALYAGNAA